MLDLLIAECSKIKRQKFIWLTMLAACLFPAPLTAMMAKDRLSFDKLYLFIVLFGYFLLMPCILGIIASILFFMERDNNTLKNLVTIPVSRVKILSAKLTLLFAIAIVYSLAAMGATLIGGIFVGRINGIPEKLGMSLILAVMITIAVLPVIAAIIYFKKSYIFSIVLSFLYTIVSFVVTLQMLNVPLPLTVVFRWMIPLVTDGPAFGLEHWFLSTPSCLGILTVVGITSFTTAIFVYKRQEA